MLLTKFDRLTHASIMAEGDGEDFWPFGGFKRFRDYDISELLYMFLVLLFTIMREI